MNQKLIGIKDGDFSIAAGSIAFNVTAVNGAFVVYDGGKLAADLTIGFSQIGSESGWRAAERTSRTSTLTWPTASNPAASAACSIDERRKPWRRNTAIAASRMRVRALI